MSQDNKNNFEDFIKKCIESIRINENKKEEKEFNIQEENTKDFDIVLEFAVNNKTGETGLSINNTVLRSWNKNISGVLLDNIEASILLLKENLK